MESKRIEWFTNISIRKKLYFAIGVMAFLIALELGTLLFSINTLSAVRAFVGAESLWSKAQKDAVYNLRKYTRSGKEADYKEFIRFMDVPLGDRITRIEMMKENPDISIMRKGLIVGRNHPDDIDGMIQLFRRFHNNAYISKAIKIWGDADSTIDEMIVTAQNIHAEISILGLNASRTDENLKQINLINKKLTLLEDEFSFTLGEGSRWLENLVLNILLIIALTVEISGLWISISISRGITKGISEIISTSKEAATGNLKAQAIVYSKDEIGQLAHAFNEMIQKLNEKIIALSESEEKFYSIFHSSSVGMTISNFSDKIILEANQVFLDSIEYSKEEVIGKNAIEIGIIDNFEERNEVLKKVNSLGRSPDFELRLRTKSGAHFDALISLTVMPIKGEKCVVSIFYDITEKKKIENDLRRKTLELASSNKELENFAHISSHDLQEPLRTVSNYMQIFEEDYLDKLDEDAKKHIYAVKNATKRMSNLIKALLDYSRLGREKKLVYINCRNIVNDVLADLNNLIETSKAKIILTDLPDLYVYETELHQLFQNLISNAIKFRSTLVPPEIKITATLKNNLWEFAVADNGIGIDEKYQSRIFDIFQRVHSATQYEGSGIGLANCKKIVEMHQGQIWAEYSLGNGSTFKFTIPIIKTT